MKWKQRAKIEDMGEQSGSEEAQCDFPFLPRLNSFNLEEYKQERRMQTRYGRARAQGLYRLRGKMARVFAHQYATGYLSTCSLFECEGHFEEYEQEKY